MNKLESWLFRTTYNSCMNIRRNRAKQHRLFNKVAFKNNNDIVDNSGIEKLKMIVNELPDRQRIALILGKFEKKSYKEISDIMGTTVKAVESLIFRAKKAIKDGLKNEQ